MVVAALIGLKDEMLYKQFTDDGKFSQVKVSTSKSALREKTLMSPVNPSSFTSVYFFFYICQRKYQHRYSVSVMTYYQLLNLAC